MMQRLCAFAFLWAALTLTAYQDGREIPQSYLRQGLMAGGATTTSVIVQARFTRYPEFVEGQRQLAPAHCFA